MKTQSSIVVKKFGGTSVGSLERIEHVAQRISRDVEAGQSPIIVSSAMSGETNRLVNLARDVYPQYKGVAYDMLLASGEQVSVSLLSMALEKRGYKALPLLAYQLGIQTDSIFSKARIQSVDSNFLKLQVEQGVIPIVAGFQGITENNQLTTLGRGGSDTTAIALTASLKLEACEIYTDVPAIFSADPRLVSRACEIKKLSFDEMMEMSFLGSKVLHFRCVELAAKYNIHIHVRSTFEDREGTWVGGESMESPVVSSVTHDASTTIFKIYPLPSGQGLTAKLFTALADENIIIDIITQSEGDKGQRLAFSLHDEDQESAMAIIQKFATHEVKVKTMNQLAKISTVGVGMRNHPGVAARFFSCLDQLKIPIHLVTTSDIKISAVIDKANLEQAANQLHTEFELDS